MSGFLGTGAPFSADLNLILQLAMGGALLIGMVLARRRQYRAHKYCQSSVVLLNLVLIALIMAPHFHQQVQNQIPAQLGMSYYAVVTAHAMVGLVAELLGLYVLLVATTQLVPPRFRFNRFKPWMRTTLGLWWAVILIGVGTYYVWYIAPPSASTAAMKHPPGTKDIVLSNFKFQPKMVTVTAGTTIQWFDSQGIHRVHADGGVFRSAVLTAGRGYTFKLNRPGVYRYYCEFHGGPNGTGMSGRIVVKAHP